MMHFLLATQVNQYSLFFIFWNVFLALIPCWIVYYWSFRYSGKKWKQLKLFTQFSFLIWFILWFFFLPNTAYLFTLVRHLLDHCSDYDLNRVCRKEAWMSIFFFGYALIGVPTFVYSLKKMSQLFRSFFGKVSAHLLPIIMIPLTSIGVLFGLVERFNSWDILSDPLLIVRTGASYFSDPVMLVNFLVYTVILYLIYYYFRWWTE